jgi:hypothetical protein
MVNLLLAFRKFWEQVSCPRIPPELPGFLSRSLIFPHERKSALANFPTFTSVVVSSARADHEMIFKTSPLKERNPAWELRRA